MIRSPAPCLQLLAILVCAAGCAPAYRNAPLEIYAPESGYRFDALKLGEGNTDELFVCLNFSGGGTRAAALSYGVLQALRDTPLPPLRGQSGRRMLDEVDAISSVSGGSFTAAGYALWREGLFDGRFEREFLKRNVQASLIWRVLAFPNVLLLPLVALDRIDIVAEYFTHHLFEERTYADLLKDGRRPFVAINATNLGAGIRLEFTQDDFDLLGSDLGPLPIGYAVGASQAVPILLSPLRLKYYAGEPSCEAIAAVFAREGRLPRMQRREQWARSLVASTRPGEDGSPCIEADRHRWLYLVDGGSADNLGLSFVIDQYQHGIIRRRIETDGPERLRRLVIIIVNAGTRPPNDIEQRDSAPGLISMGWHAAMIAVENNSYALTELARSGLMDQPQRIRELFAQCRRELERCADARPPGAPSEERFVSYLIEVNFEAHTDDFIRNELLSLPTNYNLTPEQVDRVIAASGELIRQDVEYQRLLRDVRAGAK